MNAKNSGTFTKKWQKVVNLICDPKNARLFT